MKIVPASTFVPLGGRPANSAASPALGASGRASFSPLTGVGSGVSAAAPQSASHASPASPQIEFPKPAPTSAAPSQHAPATLNVIREGDRITHIEVRCGCGEVHRIACSY